MSSIRNNLQEPTLLQESNGFFKDHEIKGNDSISENKVYGCDFK